MNTIVTVIGGNGSIRKSLNHKLGQHGLESPVVTQTTNSGTQAPVHFAWNQRETDNDTLAGAGGIDSSHPKFGRSASIQSVLNQKKF
jgi:hypothetical protein